MDAETLKAVQAPLARIVETSQLTVFKFNAAWRRNSYVVGLALEESEALLDGLWAHAANPELTWTQVWKVGDVMMWDNSCTMHRRDSFDASARRLMYRTQIAGSAAP